MIRIAVTEAAYAAICETLPLMGVALFSAGVSCSGISASSFATPAKGGDHLTLLRGLIYLGVLI
jgi:hypothetical protein